MQQQLTVSSRRSVSIVWVLSSPSWEAWREGKREVRGRGFYLQYCTTSSQPSVNSLPGIVVSPALIHCPSLEAIVQIHLGKSVTASNDPTRNFPTKRDFSTAQPTFTLWASTFSRKPLCLLNSYWSLRIMWSHTAVAIATKQSHLL